MKSPEVLAIISKIKGKGASAEPDGDEGHEEGGDAGDEAKTAAAEDLFRAIRGREPTEAETKATREAMESYMEACGY